MDASRFSVAFPLLFCDESRQQHYRPEQKLCSKGSLDRLDPGRRFSWNCCFACCDTGKVRRVGEVDGFDWWSLTTYETVTRIAVPLFFMVSGYLAIGRCVKHGDSAYAWKRGLRIMAIALFWTVAFLFWTMIRTKVGFSFASLIDTGQASPVKFVLDVFYGEAYFHLWFLWALAGIFFVTPIVAQGLSSLTQRQKVIIGCLLPILVAFDYALHRQSVQVNYFRYSLLSMGVPYLAYTCSGYLLGVGVKRCWTGLSIVMYCAAFSICLWAYSFLVGQNPTEVANVDFADKWLFMPFSIPVCLMSIAGFLMIAKSSLASSSKMPKVASRLARDSMGIYILHPFVLDIANYFDLLGRRPNAFVGTLLVTIVVVLGAWGATVALAKVPVMKKTISL